jgi:hypothetical protein
MKTDGEVISTEAISTILGMKIRQARQDRGLTLSEFAALCNLSPSYVTEIEKGRKYPKPDKIARMAEVLDVTYDELVSIKLDPSQAYLETFLSSPLLQKFPFELFGLEISDLVELITRAPTQASALIHALMEVARQYDMKIEHLLRAALRSYQEMHDNYFEDIERAVDQFVVEHDLVGEHPLSVEQLRELVETLLGYEVDETLIQEYPPLRSYRSIYVPGNPPRFLINPRLSPAQKKFVLARELGYAFLGLEERALTSAPDKVESFQQVLNDFKASYFSGALLMPRSAIVEDLRVFFALPRWEPQKLRAFLQRYDVTPEMLLYRFSELIPEYFGIKLHFLRFHDFGGEYRLTKQLNMSRLMIPSGLGLNEHHCRRWLATRVLGELATARVKDGPLPVVAAQRSRFLNSDDTYLCIGFARPLTLAPEVGSSVTVGFKYDADLVRVMRFALDPAIPQVVINETCERCPLSIEECSVRAAPPTILQEQEARRRRQEALQRLMREFRR